MLGNYREAYHLVACRVVLSSIYELVNGEYAVKELSVLSAIGGLRRDEMCKMTQEVDSQKR
jgi:hypothetical protein